MLRLSPWMVVLSLAAPVAARTPAQGPPPDPRWLPESCVLLLTAEEPETGGASEPAEERWNRHYHRGFAAVEARDLGTAESSLCKALDAARGFEARDVRFAETLDELGLVAFLREDYRTAELMQGAAATEMLLALGPPAPDLTPGEQDDCRSSVGTYLTRLGSIFERQGRAEQTAELRSAPYRVLGLRYLPAESLEPRLDWLVSRYLLLEDLAAAEWITTLRQTLRTEATDR